MNFQRLGLSGLYITDITYGTALTIGVESNDQKYSDELIDEAWNLGIRSFDTSDNYGNAEILVRYNDYNPVWGVSVLSGDGVYTAAGIGIGSSYDAVIKAYGSADYDSVLTHSNLKQYFVSYKIPNIKPNSSPFPTLVFVDTFGSNDVWKQPHKPITRKNNNTRILDHFQICLNTFTTFDDLFFGLTQNGLDTLFWLVLLESEL